VARPSFVADLAGDYVAQLIVDDGTDISVPDSVTIMAAPPVVNQPPVANAGPNQVVQAGTTVTLDGSGSTDPNGDALGFNWSLTSFPAGSEALLSDPNVIEPSFVADVPGDYVAQLIVNDGEFNSSPDTVMITVTPGAALPEADSGGPYRGLLDEPITFDGSGSADPDGGDIQSWEWDFGDGEVDSGESVTHTYAEAGVYELRLTVTDDEGQTGSTITSVTVEIRDDSDGGGGSVDLMFLWLLGLAGLLARSGPRTMSATRLGRRSQ
jgi:chitodextrinase